MDKTEYALAMLERFFGNLSPFQVVVSVVALATGAYTFYKSFLQRAKLSLFPGDAVRLVILKSGSVSAFNLMCNIVNTSMKTATLHRLEAEVVTPSREEYRFAWSLFYRYLEGGSTVQKETDIYPVAVARQDSKLLFVQFKAVPGIPSPNWPDGRYKFTVFGWVNRNDKRTSSNLNAKFHIDISPEKAQQLGPLQPQKKPVEIPIPVVEWS